MSDEDVNNLTDRIFQLEIDDDWKELHEKVIEYREANGLTISAFLRRCSLPPNNAYYKQLTSRGGEKITPSKRMRSVGREYREKATALVYAAGDQTIGDLDVQESEDLDTMLSDWNVDNYEELRAIGVTAVSLDRTGEVQFITHQLQNSTADNSVIADMLASDAGIITALKKIGKDSPTMGRRIDVRLLSLESPICLKKAKAVDTNFGWGTEGCRSDTDL